MAAAAAARRSDLNTQPEQPLKAALTTSAILHAAIIILCIVGLPHIRSERPLADAISVELLPVSELTTTNKQPARSETPQKKPNDAEKKPDQPPPSPTPPQALEKTPPKPVEPEKPAPPEKSEEAPPEEIAKPEPPKEKPKPPERKPQLTQTADAAKQEQDFQSVLKNLMPTEETAADNSQAPDVGAEPSPLAQFSQQLTMNEMDALRRQLAECWNVLAGAQFADDLIVDVKLFVNVDRTVRDAQVVDKARYFSDNYFRAAADGALRAVRNPRCNPLDLPEGKYNQWQTITVTFDPREML